MGMTSIRRVSQHMAKGVVIIIVVAMAAGLFFIGGPGLGESGPDYMYHGPSVRVNGIKLKDAEFQKQLNGVAQEMSQYAAYGFQPTMEQMREESLQRAIRVLVLQSEIKQNKIKVPAADVNRYFNRLAKQYFPTKAEKVDFYAKNNFKGDRQFKEEIRRYLEQLYLFLALSEKKKIDVKVTNAEISDAYASLEPAHILIGIQKDATDKTGLPKAEAKKKADEVYARLEAGEDWDKLAKEYSTDASNKDKGGSLGENKINSFTSQAGAVYGKDFVDEALKLKVGEYSVPIESPQGYHLIKAIARKDATGPEFNAEKRTIKAELVAQKFSQDQQAYTKWMDARVADAEVTILDSALRAYQLLAKAQGAADQSKAGDDWAQAAKFYERAVKMRQHRWDREITLSAMTIFGHEKQWDKAVSAGQQALKRFKEDADLQLALGKALYKRNKSKDRTEALALLKKAEEAAAGDAATLGKVKAVYAELKLTKQTTAVDAAIKKLLAAEQAEQERLQKQMEEEQAKQQAAGQGTQEPAAGGTAQPSSGGNQ